MNKPVQIVAEPPLDYPDYHDDGYGWALAQAAIIRAGRLDSIDWEHVAEEVESMGKSQKSSAESALRIVLMHQLKWQYQPIFRTRSWQNSIKNHLQDFDDVMADNPSLKAKLDEILARAFRRARVDASNETGFDIDLFPADPPSWDEIRAPREL